MDINRTMKHHIGNIKRAVGNKDGGKYSYIVNQNDLTNTYLQMRDELGYPLMIDSKYRRAIVYNKKGLEKKIENLINECIVAEISKLEKIITEDIINSVSDNINMLSIGKNHQSINKIKGTKSIGIGEFGRSVVKGLVNGVGKILDDMING